MLLFVDLVFTMKENLIILQIKHEHEHENFSISFFCQKVLLGQGLRKKLQT